MHKHPELTERRIERFLKYELEPLLWTRQVPMTAAVWQPADAKWPREVDPVSPAGILTPPGDEASFRPAGPGMTWGPIWSDAWFVLRGRIPEEWRGERVVARIDVGSEAIVWDGDEPMQGIDRNHGEYLLTQSAVGGEEIRLSVCANGMNPNVSVDARPRDPSPEPFTFGHAFLAVRDEALWGLYYDVKVALGVMREQPANEPRRGQLLYTLNDAVNAFEAADRGSIARSREIIARTFDRPASASAHQVSAIGHAHIDTAWLWPLERTQQKCLHTFATATQYMEQYPEYRFICSQAQQYEWVKALAPKLYERIRRKIESGHWEVTGSMWVEADCNITGGESLVRQILLAKNYWMDEFGVETVDLWLPDVFGYAAALPQILTKAGIKYFLTQKISWNQINKFPHHTFLWQGIDGTRIFTHFPPADTYNAEFTPKELAYNVHNFRDHDRANRSLYVYGYGDGGGGPTVEMLENARRLKSVEGMPRVELEKARDFFEKAEADAKDLPVWVGELYLELHRGTYTTQARNKRGNQKSEFLLRDAEFLACVQWLGSSAEDATLNTQRLTLNAYPSAELERAWKLTLLNQFHDIIPGSSVNEVYVDSERDYAEIARIGEKIVADSLAAIGEQVNTEGMTLPVMVVRNYDDWAGGEPVWAAIPADASPRSVMDCEGKRAPVQIVEGEEGRLAVFQEQTTAEGHGYTVYDLLDDAPEYENGFEVSATVLDNGLIRLEFDADGLIRRVYDHYFEREVLAAGERGNQFQLFEDKPLFWDAWDIDPYYQEKGRVLTELESVEVLETGPVRGAVRFTRRFGGSDGATPSRIVQTVYAYYDHRRIDFVTEVDWHEEHKMLKVAFPVAINSMRATYEIQYGHVERPTHYNTSWDLARFEVAAQKWVDLSEGDYGVALLNDCKYGHDTFGNTLRLTLLRSPKAPDPEADMGLHRFTYSLLPHGGGVQDGAVIESAYHLNAPPRAVVLPRGQAGPLPRETVYFDTDREGVLIEAVKKAEKEDALIVRLYDAFNRRGPCRLRFAQPMRSAHLCDLLERDIRELPLDGSSVELDVLPFEIVTIKLRPA